MSKAEWYYLITRSLWLVADLFILMVCEKWIQLITDNSTFIILVMLVYYVFVYISSGALQKFLILTTYPKLLALILIFGSLFFVITIWNDFNSASEHKISIVPVYALMGASAVLSVVTNTCLSLLMDTRVQSSFKSRLLALTCFVMGIVGGLAYFFGAIWLTDQRHIYIFLLVASGVYILIYFLIFSLCQEVETNFEVIIEEHIEPVRLNKIAPAVLFSLLFMAQLFYSSLDSLHTFYVSDVLQKGQEIQFQFLASMFVGIIIIAMFINWIIKVISLLNIFLCFFAFMMIYLTILLLHVPLVNLFVGIGIIAASANVLFTSVMIYLHQHYSKEELGKYILLMQQVESIAPCIAVILIVIANTSLSVMIVVFLIILIVPLVVIGILKQFSRDKKIY